MSAFTKHGGVFFTELSEVKTKHTHIKSIRIDIDGFTTDSQLKNLDNLKDALAREVLRLGGNALKAFKYGQRSVGFLGSILSLDDVKWYGSGDVIIIHQDKK